MANVIDSKQLTDEIMRLKQQRNAIILSHVYQPPEIQEIADLVGDSLELSRQAAATNASVIVFCGVHFMAESAAILSPQKTVLLPEVNAGCPMADMVTAEALRAKKAELPGALVVCYVNTSAEVKAECDIACTSANAVQVVASLPSDRPVIFVPDKNLGRYVAKQSGRAMHIWEGCCPIHNQLAAEDVLQVKSRHPGALVLVHPECRPDVIELADHVASTTGMLRFARENPDGEYIVATEKGILHQFNKQCPDKNFYPASDKLICRDMQATTLEKVLRSLQTLEPRVTVTPEIGERALKCLERMLAV
ncbi:quinolinate synthase NadA [Desulfoscipio gibsoniae]|uniref:Quinolinate synthase n=1 Tax=Desulfoscipio gibsoniae DSM 7213 TaxID=767817 RepID=R4KH57_9FIRM|nr:quinolinate synthase NadA [Desulfoscipio gibsoniae]AGK99874.1 quinolinate synthetase complex, A subunit [Desulfoscipio gibsoniae DSM 7213]